ncbi:MAG: quinone-dependent dihydroorotate dehydrogenase [Pseudomonadales bacterium]|nr:quinone-dependent dihydroorotate dehydrogenase [Pseudomonadales bacterium]
MWYPLLRQLLFTLPEEQAHQVALRMISLGATLGLVKRLVARPPTLPVKVMGLDFPNPLGLAAGMDKNAQHIHGLGDLGFGFVEVGTVTPRPQPGNPKPRLFRLPEAHALINRMGFNNFGLNYLVRQVETARYPGILGINIGKNKDTPVERALDDYQVGLDRVYPLASYVVVNISSPNTQGLRTLQTAEYLRALLEPLKEQQDKLATRHGRYVPLVVKIAPDLSNAEITDIAECLVACRMDGVAATNTTITRPGLDNVKRSLEEGGLSGLPLKPLALDRQQALVRALRGRLPVIGLGGIMSADDALERMQEGASLIQIYTGFIYEGPVLIQQILQRLAHNTHLWRGSHSGAAGMRT